MPKLLFLVTEDWYFCSHRLPLAIAAREAGYDVTVATRVDKDGDRIRDAGLNLLSIRLSRESTNPWREAAAFGELVKLYRSVRPDIAHHVAIKPILYGSAAARITAVRVIVNAIAGLGYVFSSDEIRARMLRPFVRAAYRGLIASEHGWVIVQNPEDERLLIDLKMAPRSHVSLIRGSGVDLNIFVATPEPGGPVIITLPARMLRDKGVYEFIDAARILKRQDVDARFVLVGEPDLHNPTSVTESQLRSWRDEGVIEWWGWRNDMAEVFRRAHVVCLPSYREGLPKVLIEAAACARAIVTCDVPGCRDVVLDGFNGLLVPPKDRTRLAAALARLIRDPALRQTMGKRGRERAEREYSVDRVIKETIALYEQRLCR